MLRSPPAPPPLLASRLGLLSLSCSLHILCPWLSSRRLHRPLQNLAHVHNSGPHLPPVSPAPLLASGPAPPRHSPSTEACCARSRQTSSLPAPRPSDSVSICYSSSIRLASNLRVLESSFSPTSKQPITAVFIQPLTWQSCLTSP